MKHPQPKENVMYVAVNPHLIAAYAFPTRQEAYEWTQRVIMADSWKLHHVYDSTHKPIKFPTKEEIEDSDPSLLSEEP